MPYSLIYLIFRWTSGLTRRGAAAGAEQPLRVPPVGPVAPPCFRGRFTLPCKGSTLPRAAAPRYLGDHPHLHDGVGRAAAAGRETAVFYLRNQVYFVRRVSMVITPVPPHSTAPAPN